MGGGGNVEEAYRRRPGWSFFSLREGLQSILAVANVVVELNAGRFITLTQSRLKEARKVNVNFLTASLLREELRVADSDSAIEAKESALQTLSGFASESWTFRAESSPLWVFVETLGCAKLKIVMVTRDVQELNLHSKKIRADAENMREQNTELACEVRGKDAP